MIQGIWEEQKMIYGWRTARIYPTFKGGEENGTNNYRGISLLDIRYKIIAGIMNHRLAQWITATKSMKESQAGFRGRRGTRDHVFVLNSKGRLYATFVDFKTAFDTVNRDLLLEKLAKMGIQGKFLEWIRDIYKETWCEIITEEGISRRFETGVGVRQGCPLSGQ